MTSRIASWLPAFRDSRSCRSGLVAGRFFLPGLAVLNRYPGPVERALVLAEMLGGLSAEDREYRTVDQ